VGGAEVIGYARRWGEESEVRGWAGVESGQVGAKKGRGGEGREGRRWEDGGSHIPCSKKEAAQEN